MTVVPRAGRTVATLLTWAFAATAGAQPAAQPATAETVAEIRVHGNYVTPDQDVLRIAAVPVGSPFTATTIADVRQRLEAAGRFQSIEVLKRFASIEDPSRIALVIVVNEGPVRVELPDLPGSEPRVLRRRGLRNLMVMPILDGEDGYGLTYGARLAYLLTADHRSRVSFPLTWGGLKRAGAEFDRRLSRGPFDRVEVGAAIQRQRNPAFDQQDDWRRIWTRAERLAGPVRVAGTASWQRVSFAGLSDDVASAGAEVVVDTRLDPVLPRNAVLAAVSWERLSFSSRDALGRTRLEGQGYLGLLGQTVLVARITREDASAPLPPYLRSLVGGWSSLRGFKAGALTGDTAVFGSIELRVPLSSPLSVGRLGVSVFVDAGTAYEHGQPFRTAEIHQGAGGSVWIALPIFRMSLSVAHGRAATTRVHFGVTLAL